MYQELNEMEMGIKQEDDLVDSALLNITIDTNKHNEKPIEINKEENVIECPINLPPADSLKTAFDFHYELDLYSHQYDFFFDSFNYTTESYQNSKQLHKMPRHLRNTLFIRTTPIKQIRIKTFSEIFIIAEEIKENANKLYNDEYYEEALGKYNIVYSLFKWLEFGDKSRENSLFNNYNSIISNPIVDNDILHRACRYNKRQQHEQETYNFSITVILKAMSYCYINLQLYSEAIKCLDEAFEYTDDTQPDIYFRRAQARMYNKYSSRKMLQIANEDFAKSKQRKPNQKIIEDEHDILINILQTKQSNEINAIKKLIHNVTYAYGVIRKKNLKTNEVYCRNYDMNHLNYKIMKEMKEAYQSSLKHYKKTGNLMEYRKGLKEFEEFMDGMIQYKFFYELDMFNLGNDVIGLLSSDEKRNIRQFRVNEIMRNLLDDFKYKKCDEIHMNMHFNQRIWEKCYDMVNEKEKLSIDYDPSKESNSNSDSEMSRGGNSGVLCLLLRKLKDVGNLFRMTTIQLYFLCFIIVIIILFGVISQTFFNH